MNLVPSTAAKAPKVCSSNATRGFQIIPRLKARVEQEKVDGATIFFTQDSHVPDDREFEMFPPHCIEGSEEEEIVDELAPLTADARIVKKRRYSAFYNTDLADQLAEL